ncbi:hypothetical protein B296_00038307 [Ensete ventricosum]|uniref:Uncharacterized protein n=1 Tax=Ensete ventricosum TaxID=4639 RepID=A0A426Y2I3_ENSVE|nr:hypothetical protein B296_00038307 [Ensete ventricosum]
MKVPPPYEQERTDSIIRGKWIPTCLLLLCRGSAALQDLELDEAERHQPQGKPRHDPREQYEHAGDPHVCVPQQRPERDVPLLLKQRGAAPAGGRRRCHRRRRQHPRHRYRVHHVHRCDNPSPIPLLRLHQPLGAAHPRGALENEREQQLRLGSWRCGTIKNDSIRESVQNIVVALLNRSIFTRKELMCTLGILDALATTLQLLSPFAAQHVIATFYSLLFVDTYYSIIRSKRNPSSLLSLTSSVKFIHRVDAVENSLGVRWELAEGIGSLSGWCKGVLQKKTETCRKIIGGSRKACRERFAEGIGKLVGNMPRDRRKKTKRLTTRTSEAAALAGVRS